jgi:hypothetical protein
MSERKNRKRHSPEQIIAKLREADAMLAGGGRADLQPPSPEPTLRFTGFAFLEPGGTMLRARILFESPVFRSLCCASVSSSSRAAAALGRRSPCS